MQLTEFAKIAYILAMAWFFKNHMSPRMELGAFIWVAVNFMLILLLPDLGSIMILLPLSSVVFTVMTSQYLKTLLIVGLGGAGLGLSLPSWSIRSRIQGWLTLWTEVNAQNDQIIRGLQAMGRGGLVGTGIGTVEPRLYP